MARLRRPLSAVLAFCLASGSIGVEPARAVSWSLAAPVPVPAPLPSFPTTSVAPPAAYDAPSLSLPAQAHAIPRIEGLAIGAEGAAPAQTERSVEGRLEAGRRLFDRAKTSTRPIPALPSAPLPSAGRMPGASGTWARRLVRTALAPALVLCVGCSALRGERGAAGPERGNARPAAAAESAPRALESLVEGIEWKGGSVPARREAARIIRDMMAGSPSDLVERLARARITLVLVPKGTRIYDAPEAAPFRPRPDPRRASLESTVGLTVWKPDGTITALVPEENLLGEGRGPGGSLGREIMIHEWAHVVLFAGFPQLQGRVPPEIESLYGQTERGIFPFPDEYASSEAHEFFAQATTIWFGAHEQTAYRGFWPVRRDPDWIRKNHPGLYRALHRLYGPPRRIGPDLPVHPATVFWLAAGGMAGAFLVLRRLKR